MPEQLKNLFFQKKFFTDLAGEIQKVHKDFDPKQFLRLIYTDDWNKKSLKQRMRHASKALGKTLPPDYQKAINILLKVEKHFKGFDHLIFSDFVEVFGLDHFEISMKALETFTRTSSEFAIRPFIKKYPRRSMQQMAVWSKSKKEHLRRLASEGCRPRLPWGMSLPQFKQDPKPIFSILENLKNDPSEYVRRSVANNLNDISKDHPALILKLGKKWFGKTTDTDKLIKHALRGLLKQGNPEAMKLFGFGDVKNVKITDIAVKPNRIQIGENGVLTFDLKVSGGKKLKLRLEYIIEYIKLHGKKSSKIFQIIEDTFPANSQKTFTRKLIFRNMTTRKHYPGKHKVTIVVNGYKLKQVDFYLQK